MTGKRRKQSLNGGGFSAGEKREGQPVPRFKKYFVVTEGSDRAILRSNVGKVLEKKRILKAHKGVKAHVFVATEKLEDPANAPEAYGDRT